MSGEGTFDLYSLSELLHAVHWPQNGCIFRCLFFFSFLVEIIDSTYRVPMDIVLHMEYTIL